MSEIQSSQPDLSSFTVRAQRILAYAQEEAARFGQAHVAPEHLLLGLLREEDTLAVRVLRNRGIVPQTLRAEIEQRIEQGTARSAEPLPFTPRSLRVIALSHVEAHRMYNRYIGTEHLLLGLMREQDSLAGRLIAHHGIDLEGLRRSFLLMQEVKDVTDQVSTTKQQQEVDALIAILRKEGRKRQPSMSEWICYFALIVFSPITLFVVCQLIWQLWTRRVDWNSVGVLAWLLLVDVTTFRSIATSRQKAAARKLVEYQDLRTLGDLILFLDWPDEIVKAGAVQALTKLLPQLRAGHANLLNPRLRRILYSKLDPLYVRRESDFVIAILKSLEQVGDGDALPYVQKLAARKAVSFDQKRVQEAANACLLFLQERVQQTQTRETLLRAASATAVSSENLLRPAQETSTPPDQLLRPPGATQQDATGSDTL